MQVPQIIAPILEQLAAVLLMLEEKAYTKPVVQLNQASIGGHTRHVIELFQCLLKGYGQGIVNYDKRVRDLLIETDRELAIELITGIIQQSDKPNISLTLQASHSASNDQPYSVETNYHREILYNLEHTIHHMALMRVGIQEVSSLQLSPDFGVAPSTIKYRQACVQ